MSPERWARVCEDAEQRAEVVEAVATRRQESGESWRRCLAAVASEVGWSAYLHWRRRYRARSGPGWERLLDERLPPPPANRVRDEIRLAACMLRRADRGMSTETARTHLVMPREIYARDTDRDSVMTCLKMNALMLIEFVLKEYFGSLGMEWRTFINQLVPLPLTVRTTRHIIRYQLHANPRRPGLMDDLREACAELTRRRLRSGKQRLVFEFLDAPDRGS